MNSSLDIVQSATSPWVLETLDLIDATAHDRVLLYGALPPDGSDLDLLAWPADLAAIRMALMGVGFVPGKETLIRFRPGCVERVDLCSVAAWELPPDELAALFADAQPLEGVRRVVRPSPHHALLIHARKAMRRERIPEKALSRVDDALAEDPDAWQRAAERASAWHARQALSLLRSAYVRAGQPSRHARWRARIEAAGASGVHPVRVSTRLLRPFLARWRQPSVITLSGLDGSGKTSQAVLLRNTLTTAGYDAVIIWAGIGRNRILGQIKAPVKRRLLALPSVGPWAGIRDRITQTGEQKSGLKTDRKQPQRRGFWLDLVTVVWATIVTLVNIMALRRKVLRSLGSRRVIIFDRYTLDSAVKLRHWYGDTWATQLLTGAIHHTTTRPLRAYFLDVAPQVAFDRKHEWDLDDLTCRAVLYHEEYAGLGVRRLDGARTVTDLNAEIAAEVWQALQ